MVFKTKYKELEQPNQAKLWALINRTLVPAKLREQKASKKEREQHENNPEPE